MIATGAGVCKYRYRTYSIANIAVAQIQNAEIAAGFEYLAAACMRQQFGRFAVIFDEPTTRQISRADPCATIQIAGCTSVLIELRSLLRILVYVFAALVDVGQIHAASAMVVGAS
jgi:hypothetical protein